MGEPVADLIAQWLAEPENVGRWVTVAELSQALGDLAEDKGISVRGLRNPRSLAQKLRGLTSSLQEQFEISERTGKGRRRYLSFRPREPAEGSAPWEAVQNAS